MQLAVQYSPQAEALLQQGKITFDLYKCPDWDDLVATAQASTPAYVHFPLMAGRGVGYVDWDKIDRLMAQTKTDFVNLHLAPFTGDFPGLKLEDDTPEWREKLIARMIADIDVVKARYGAERVILENVPYDASPHFAIPVAVLHPDVVRTVVQETGCGLLMDTAHARIAAIHLNIDPIAYVRALPGEVMRELHVTGIIYEEESARWRDHFQLSAEDWALAEFVFDQIKAGVWAAPEIVAFEYGGVGEMFEWRSETRVLAHDVPRLHALVESIRSQKLKPTR